MISNEIDEAEEEEQSQFNIIDRNLFGIRRRYTKLTDKNIAIDNIETAKDALEDLELKSNTSEVIQHGCSEHEHLKPKDKVKYVILILFGITGCYISYKCMPMYLVSTYCKINNYGETNKMLTKSASKLSSVPI